MARFTRELRQEIVREFAVRHNGLYDPALFFAEVEATGQDHPAYGWFEWDHDKAAREYRLWQARAFANGLRVVFRIEEVGRSGPMKIREAEMPLVLSPVDTRRSGGGYILVDTGNPDHMAEHCRQAATALRTWFDRYESALIYAGASTVAIEKAMKVLDAAAVNEPEKAAA